jgi:hypothetical protein
MAESVTTTAAEPSAPTSTRWVATREKGESARLQRQSEELRSDSTALLDPAGLAATPFKTVPPPGSGLGTRVHVAPSQRSISALSNMPAPTAQASSAETAAAPLR